MTNFAIITLVIKKVIESNWSNVDYKFLFRMFRVLQCHDHNRIKSNKCEANASGEQESKL